MKNSLFQRRILITVRRFLVVILAGIMLLGLNACAKPNDVEEDEPITVTVEREAGPEALQTANAATALALRYYIFARLKTEAFISANFKSMPAGGFAAMMDELVMIWQTADELISEAEEVNDQAILLLEASSAGQTAADMQPQGQFATLATKGSGISTIPLADDTGDVIDRQTWAENLSKQYDALRGGQRYKQLAQQLGTDTQTAVEQMALAQKIIRSAADLEEAQAEVGAYTQSINIVEGYKTASKVGLFVGATVATGGGTLTALAGSSMSVPVAGALIVGGVDCVVDVGKTTSSIILGEDHQVAVDFQKAGDVIQPVSMVLGLVTMDPSSAAYAAERVAFLGEAMMEWCYPGKVTGIAVETTKKGNSLVMARIIELMGENIPDVEKTLEGLNLAFPKEDGVSLKELILSNTVDSETALEKMRELKATITALEQEDEGEGEPPQEPEPSDDESGTLTGGQPQASATGHLTTQDLAGTYSGSATLQHLEDGIEAPDSISVTLQLGEDGTGTADVDGFGGEAQCAGSSVSFFITMEDVVPVSCEFEGTASRSGSQVVIDGEIHFSMMGVTFASYAWTAYK